jgi:hypothetical protein
VVVADCVGLSDSVVDWTGKRNKKDGLPKGQGRMIRRQAQIIKEEEGDGETLRM